MLHSGQDTAANPNGGGGGKPESRSRMRALEYLFTHSALSNSKADVDCVGTHVYPEASDPGGHQMPISWKVSLLGVILRDVNNRR